MGDCVHGIIHRLLCNFAFLTSIAWLDKGHHCLPYPSYMKEIMLRPESDHATSLLKILQQLPIGLNVVLFTITQESCVAGPVQPVASCHSPSPMLQALHLFAFSWLLNCTSHTSPPRDCIYESLPAMLFFIPT